MTELPLYAIGLIGAGIFFVLMFLRLHVGVSLMIAAFIGILLSRGLDPALSAWAMTLWRTGNSVFLVVIPLFIVMGTLASYGGVTTRAFDTFYKLIGHLKGGLGMATVGTCAAFAAVCGDNIATAATMNKAALPEMRRYGYKDRLSFGSICGGGNLGLLIPPSAAFVVFGFITETSIAALFVAGVLPGLLLTLMFMGQIRLQCAIDPSLCQLAPKAKLKDRVTSLTGLIGIVAAFVLVMGGMLTGLFTPSEAGAAGAFAIFVIGLLYRTMSMKGVGRALVEATKLSAMILLLIMGAKYFSTFLTTSEIAPAISNAIIEAGFHKYVVMAMLVVLYVVLGMVMDIWSVIIITMPIFFPILVEMGFDPLQIGVVAITCIMMGTITPPVGVVVFTISGMNRDVPMYTIYRGCIPFVLTMVLFIVIIVLVPELSTLLADWLYR